MKNQLLIDLLKKTKNYLLLAQYEMGKLNEYEVLQAVLKKVKDDTVREKLSKLLELAKPKLTKPTPTEKPKAKAKEVCVSNLEMLEALKHGISTETYLFNKHLSLTDKLALPDAWQVIYALNYKEKKHGRRKGKRKTV